MRQESKLWLGPWADTPQEACVVVKRSYAIERGKCELSTPAPLHRLDGGPDSPFPMHKRLTDVIVRGSAASLDERPVMRMTVAVEVGRARKAIVVTGDRAISWDGSHAPIISPPRPFVSMPLRWENAYGGVDARVRPTRDVTLDQFLTGAMCADGPGYYPRNPIGKGYLVRNEPLDGAEMPNLEDPEDLLTAERLVAGDPAKWYTMPLPWCFERVPLAWFPRARFLGPEADPWFPPPYNERLAEIRRGFLKWPIDSSNLAALLSQEASHGLSIASLSEAHRVVIEGMTADERRLSFALPPELPPAVFTVERRSTPVPLRALHVIIEPNKRSVSITWSASIDLERVFIPGVHKHVPVSVAIDGDRPIAYEPPPTFHDQLVAAGLRPSGAPS